MQDKVITDTILPDSGSSGNMVLESEVKYSSEDSLSISLGQEKIFLFRNADVSYQNINLKADYIEFDMRNYTVTAAGLPDSTGNIAGKPSFTQGSETFDSDSLRYNFDTQKGLIKSIVTQEGEGYLHSEKTKRFGSGEIHISSGKYTTCDAEHPHFYIQITKGIAIPDEKLLSGPAYLVVEDIPLPIALPFGFYPYTETRTTGLIIPTYGEEKTRGFFLRNGGWYFAFSDYIDLSILGTLYSRGTWGLTASSVYNVRYRFSGRFNVDFYNNKVRDDPGFTGSKDLRISWTHSQDAKANPSRKFSANVNFSTMSYDKNHSYNIDDYITNTKSSSISFSKNWPGSPFNLTANLNQSQNSQSRIINMTFPSMTFNMSRIYPFRGKDTSGDYNWFQNIQISYSSKLENRISAPDSTFFTKKTLDDMKNGFYHSIPISLTNIKILKYINISPSVSYSGILYTSYLEKRPNPDTAIYSERILNDTIRKLTYAQSISTSIGISASPKIYGMFQSTRENSYIAAIRHVMTPSVSFSFSPDLSAILPDYYRKFVTPGTITKPSRIEEYSIYENNLYGTPVPQGKSGSLSFGLNNNLEMKVRPRNDSIGELKKVILLNNLNFRMSYNPFATAFHWSSLNMSGSTSFFDQQLSIQFGASFDPYMLDSAGRRIDRYLILEKAGLFRTTNANISANFNLRSGEKSMREEDAGLVVPEPEDESNTVLTPLNESIGYFGAEYVNFNIPWSLNVNYNWSYSKQGQKASFNHTVRISGDISLTPKWKIGVNSGFDFVSRKITTTNISIYRDLHCWDMRFSVIPFGDRRSYTFTISAKSSILRDVKYSKSRSWYDNF
ncbi:MAG: LPS-assembly protein LptD [Bacteroidales bacterium]|nr:LPS-assembly protein LptD [Bacteroidales bacterium]